MIVDELSFTVLESFSGADAAKYALHAINSHDELVEEVERLTRELKIVTAQLIDADDFAREVELDRRFE